MRKSHRKELGGRVALAASSAPVWRPVGCRSRLLLLAVLAWILYLPLGSASEAENREPEQGVQIAFQSFRPDGPLDGLEPERLDFRYGPSQGQCCIGLVDDPFKTVVGSDGGLYYDYGQRGPEPYSNGMGVFGTRVLAGLVAGSEGPGTKTQHLLDAKTPIVITESRQGGVLLRQRAWAGLENVGAGSRRVDYLWLTATATDGATPDPEIELDVGCGRRLYLNEARDALVAAGPDPKTLCRFSRPPIEEPADHTANASDGPDDRRLIATRPITVERNWAHPQSQCSGVFRHVLVGWAQPLRFEYRVKDDEPVRVMLGFIEGWHADPGKRPVEIRVEGESPRRLDLITEFGRNVPVVLPFDADDVDGDGALSIDVWPVAGSEDRNTILSGLWVFRRSDAPTADELVQGTPTAASPIAEVHADAMPEMPRPRRLTWKVDSLQPGRNWELLIALPQSGPRKETVPLPKPQDALEKSIAYWRAAALPYDRIGVPDPSVQGLLDSSIRNIYQARELDGDRPKFQVGPTCYRGTWAADGPFILEAVTYLGRTAEARAGLVSQVDGDTGPGGTGFSKKSGLRLWMILRHAELTGDRKWLEKMWPRVEREVQQIQAYRRMTMDDPEQANYGLMPIGFGDGGLGGRHREYTNVYWTLAGLKSAITAARMLGKSTVESAWEDEYADYWSAFDHARQRDQLIDEHGNRFVPVTMKGEAQQLPQRGAWAFMQSVYPGRIFEPADPLMLGTLGMLDANQREGLIFGTGWIEDGIWNYAASFYAHAHLWLGHGRKAAATMYAFGNHASPMLCWREEQRPQGAPPRFVGDMPHNWASAEFIRLVRHLLVLERGDELHLFEGIPRSWTRRGAETRLTEIPTSLGTVSLQLAVDDAGRSAILRLHFSGARRPKKIVVHSEQFEWPVHSVTVGDGQRLPLPAVTSLPGRSETRTAATFRLQ